MKVGLTITRSFINWLPLWAAFLVLAGCSQPRQPPQQQQAQFVRRIEWCVVRDGRRVEPPLKRFDSIRLYSEGSHRICFDLQRLARGEEHAPLDLTRIQSFHFCVKGLSGPRRVDLHRVLLR